MNMTVKDLLDLLTEGENKINWSVSFILTADNNAHECYSGTISTGFADIPENVLNRQVYESSWSEYTNTFSIIYINE